MDLAREMLRRALCDQLRSAVEHSQNTPYWMKRHMPAIHKETNKGIIMDDEAKELLEGASIWVNAHPNGIYLFHGVSGIPMWLDRDGSDSADATLKDFGWRRVSPWGCSTHENGVTIYDCFVTLDESLVE